MQLKTIIVDDEPNNIRNIESILQKHCENIDLVGNANSVESANRLIKEVQPDLVFLDIEMPKGNAFDLLESLEDISFEIIFVTAYNQYAIKAIRFSALDYILKPINIENFKEAVNKAVEKATAKNNNDRLENFIKNINQKPAFDKRIALPTEDRVVFIPTKDILYCKGENNYTNFVIKDGSSLLVSRTLKEYEELLDEHGFVRIHQSFLINLKYIKSYVKSSGGYVIMENGEELSIARQRKELFLNKLQDNLT